MRLTQIRKAGIPVNKWADISDNVFQILFSNEGSLYPSKKTSQFYLDSSNDLLYVRYTDGMLLTDPCLEFADDYVKVEIDGTTYYSKLVHGGYNDENIGTYHEVYDTDEITLLKLKDVKI